MKKLFLITLLPFWSLGQLPDEMDYHEPVDSTRPVFRQNAFSFGISYSQRKVVEKTTPAEPGFEYQKSLRMAPLHSLGFRLGFLHTHNRFYVPFEMGLNFYDINITSDISESYTDFLSTDPAYYTKSGYSHSTRYHVHETRFVLSGGVGVRLFPRESRINIIPLVKASPSYNIRKRTLEKSDLSSHDYIKHYPDSDSTFHSDTLTSHTTYDIISVNLDVMAGVIFTYKLHPDLFLHAEYCLGVLPSSIIRYHNTRSTISRDQLAGYLSVSICYSMPGKTSYKWLKPEKEVPEVFEEDEE